jgi:hypothetical protein
MKYFETKHEKDSARITTLIAVILILLIFIVGPKYLDPPEEYGIAVNFGTTDFGSGNVQPKEPIKSEPEEVIEQPKVQEETQPETSKPQETKEEVLTEDNAESIAMKKQKEVERKKAIEDAKAKAEAERIEKERKAQEVKKKQLDDLIGGIGKTDGKETGGEGDDNKAGDKGQLDGDPYAPSYFGEPMSGGGGGYGLRGRGRPTKSKVVPECDEEGSVVVEIHVNRNGSVVNAVPGKKGTTGALCLYDAAKKTAMTYKWPADSKAPAKQVGFVVINFSVTQ